ncbi:MAG: alpha/beta hydrolase [Mycobacterium sp.]|uniref:alpha/beta hydrolase n=2 Tax=Mycobacterium sp. TaxID=1785 RepID=UPI003C4B8804
MELPREALDPEIREAVRDIPDFVFSVETVPMMRANAVFVPVDSQDIERTELRTGPEGGVELTLLRPRDAVGDLPVLYWMHGGGTVIGNRFMDNDRLNEWSRSLSCVCVSVEYRLAPEAPYPAAIDDCDEGLRYIFEHAAELRLDTHRIGLAGRSAGGGLAAALALRWRDGGDDRVAFQYLEYPMLDDRMSTPSSMLDGLPLWSRESNAFGWRAYLGDRCGTDSVPPDAAPGRASELAGLPPTFITVGTADCLRDEAIDFAARLCQAGVLIELHVYAGAVHGFDMFAGCAVVRCAARDSADWLARQFR